MHRIHVLTGVLLLTASSFAQQPQNPNPDAYTREPYNRPVERTSGAGNWGLLGLLGLTGLLGLRRRGAIGRDEYDTGERRKVA
jgi:MYXO-CTERM domain-containing protein